MSAVLVLAYCAGALLSRGCRQAHNHARLAPNLSALAHGCAVLVYAPVALGVGALSGVCAAIAHQHQAWPLVDVLPHYGAGQQHANSTARHAPFIGGANLTSVHIGGGGTIDGDGLLWWLAHYLHLERATRPSLFECLRCDVLEIENATFVNSGFWTIRPVLSRSVVVRGVTVRGRGPNTDGVNPDACANVLIENCAFHVGDDAIAIKSGWDCAAHGFPPSSNITVRRIVANGGGGGVNIGSEMSSGVEHVHVHDIRLRRVAIGVQVKTGSTRGGFIRHVLFERVEIVDAVQSAIHLTGTYSWPNPHCGDSNPLSTPPDVSNVTFREFNATSSVALFASGIASRPWCELRREWVERRDCMHAQWRAVLTHHTRRSQDRHSSAQLAIPSWSTRMSWPRVGNSGGRAPRAASSLRIRATSRWVTWHPPERSHLVMYI